MNTPIDEVRVLNGYIYVFNPDHPNAVKSGVYKGFVYEHTFVASQDLGRPISDSEVVHHLDGDGFNNQVENLLVLDRGQHAKLHGWIDRWMPYSSREDRGRTIRVCKICGRTLQKDQWKACSKLCRDQLPSKVEWPSKEVLELLLAEHPMTTIGKMFGC